MPKLTQATIGILIIALILILGFAFLKPKPTGQIIANELYNNKTTTSSTTTSTTILTTSSTSTTTTSTTSSTTSTTATSTTTSTTTTTTIKPYIVSLNLENETVQINGSANIKNWTMHDKGNNYNYIFNITLNNLITLHTKYGTDNTTDIFWDYNISVWNNNGDTAYLLDNQGNLVDNLSCSSGKCSVKNTTTITTTSTTTTSTSTSSTSITTTTTTTTTTQPAISHSGNILINEIMYNPADSDYTNEWVEIYNNGNFSVNISKWNLTDNYATDHLIDKNAIIFPYSFAIITDNDTVLSFPNITHLFVDDNTIGNGLANTDEVNLSYNNYSYFVNYSDDASNGYSLERNSSGWYQSNQINGTPGQVNSIE